MQKFKNPRIGLIGEAILATIAVVGIISIVAIFPGLPYALAPFIKKKKQPRRQNIQLSLDSLIKKGLVKRTVRKDGEIILELTRKGKWEALLRTPSFDTKRPKWDTLWRVVIFDVPQSKNKIRHELRRAMKLYGFRMLQQSVWVYPHPCDDFVGVLKKHLGVSNDVLYMKVAFIENDTYLRKEFGL